MRGEITTMSVELDAAGDEAVDVRGQGVCVVVPDVRPAQILRKQSVQRARARMTSRAYTVHPK